MAALGLAFAFPVRAQLTRPQTIQLHRGWNSVFLEVMPANGSPATVFAGAPVDIVATFLNSASTVQFIKNPANIGWKRDGWGVWYAPGRPDSFLSTLHGMDGNRAYLIHATADHTLTIEGAVAVNSVRWKPDSYNFVGFCLDTASPPTFEKFFAGSKAHRHFKIYRLANDQWTPVTNPTGTVMRASEAFWIHCRGGSDYQGPLSVKLPAGRQLVFSEGGSTQLVFGNQSADPSSVRVETMGNSAPPMAFVVQGITEGRINNLPLDFPADYRLPTLEPGAKGSLRLVLRKEQMPDSLRTALLKITADCGAQLWVPVVASRSDLSSNP